MHPPQSLSLVFYILNSSFLVATAPVLILGAS